jgi:heme exporter protein D
MINEIISMNGYGVYVWSAFSFTLIGFGVLYAVVKVQLVKEKVKFNAKFVTLTSEKKQTAKTQETYREILRNTSIYKI